MHFSFKKKVAAAATTLAIVAAAGGAYAYFTTTGSGTGTGTVGTSSALVLHQDTITYSNPLPAENALVPGTSAIVTFKVDNLSTGHQRLDTIKLASWSSNKPGCDSATVATWITMPDVTVGTDYAPGSAQVVAPAGTITFNNLPTSQDVCKSATLTFDYTSN